MCYRGFGNAPSSSWWHFQVFIMCRFLLVSLFLSTSCVHLSLKETEEMDHELVRDVLRHPLAYTDMAACCKTFTATEIFNAT